MMYYSYLYEQKLWRKLFPLKKIAIDCGGASMSWALASSLRTDAAQIYLGLTFKHCYMLELF